MIQLTPTLIQRITPYAYPSTLAIVAPMLNATMVKYDITTLLRQAHFMAQIIHESGSFNYTRELDSGKQYESRTDLGNTLEDDGDGPKFKGRGYIQLTGKGNYIEYGEAVGEDLITDPDLVATKYPCDVAGWYWKKHAINPHADQDDIKAVTRIINGGYNGLASRQIYLDRAKVVFGISNA